MFNKPHVKVQNAKRNIRVKTPIVRGIPKGTTKQNPPVKSTSKEK